MGDLRSAATARGGFLLQRVGFVLAEIDLREPEILSVRPTVPRPNMAQRSSGIDTSRSS